MRGMATGLMAALLAAAAASGGEPKPTPVPMPMAVKEAKLIRPAHVLLRELMQALEPGVVPAAEVPADLNPVKLAEIYRARREGLAKGEPISLAAPAAPVLLYVGPILNSPDRIAVTGGERVGETMRVTVTVDKFFGALRRNIIWRPMLVIPLGDLARGTYAVTVATAYEPRGGAVPPGYAMPAAVPDAACTFIVEGAGGHAAPPAFDRADTAAVIVLRYSGGMIANPGTTPYLRVYGSGRVRVHHPAYARGAGDYEGRLAEAPLTALVTAVQAAVTGYDARRALEGMRKTGRMVAVADAATTHVAVSVKGGDREVQAYALQLHARLFPEVKDYALLNDVVEKLRDLEKTLDLKKVD